jgi:hypothetical protein
MTNQLETRPHVYDRVVVAPARVTLTFNRLSYLFPYRVGCNISPTSLAIPAYGAVPRETAPVASPPHGCWQPS